MICGKSVDGELFKATKQKLVDVQATSSLIAAFAPLLWWEHA
jgi:hypothetical protein